MKFYVQNASLFAFNDVTSIEGVARNMCLFNELMLGIHPNLFVIDQPNPGCLLPKTLLSCIPGRWKGEYCAEIPVATLEYSVAKVIPLFVRGCWSVFHEERHLDRTYQLCELFAHSWRRLLSFALSKLVASCMIICGVITFRGRSRWWDPMLCYHFGPRPSDERP